MCDKFGHDIRENLQYFIKFCTLLPSSELRIPCNCSRTQNEVVIPSESWPQSAKFQFAILIKPATGGQTERNRRARASGLDAFDISQKQAEAWTRFGSKKTCTHTRRLPEHTPTIQTISSNESGK